MLVVCDLSEGCECWTAVTRAFRELKEKNESDTVAFTAATRIYRYHHPEVPSMKARFTVAEWLDESDMGRG